LSFSHIGGLALCFRTRQSYCLENPRLDLQRRSACRQNLGSDKHPEGASGLLYELLSAKASIQPARPAIRCRGHEISYGELEETSSRLASFLIDAGIRRGDRVGILLEKSIESVVSVFGILKRGASYVPLDRFSPPKRILSLMRDCGISALVSNRAHLQRLGSELEHLSSLRAVVLAPNPSVSGPTAAEVSLPLPGQTATLKWPDLSAFKEAPSSRVDGQDLAYILYTSGSTGVPKGVAISHGACLAFVKWAGTRFRVSANDRLASHAPLHFDLSTFDLFAAIRSGAVSIVVPRELSAFPMELCDFVEREQITIWYSVPSVLASLVTSGALAGTGRLASLRTILFAGEVFPMKHLRSLHQLVPRPELFNLFGPTETNVCTYYQVRELPQGDSKRLPIGKACEGTEVWIQRNDGSKASPGESGELVVQGPSLMDGYWKRPAKTAEVLVPADSGCTGDRVYRTGDWAEMDATGILSFLGRRDEMVKRRGYRIELGELEAILSAHPDVFEVAVIAVGEDDVVDSIRAIVVRRPDCSLETNKLEEACRDHLPPFMIPDCFEFRNHLPHTATGKVDKARLRRECS